MQVTWDEYSLIVNGSRVDVFSGEVHPYRYAVSFNSREEDDTVSTRMPVQSLHLDVFQKIK